MKYAALIYEPVDAPALTPEEGAKIFAAYDAFTKEGRAKGVVQGGEPLQPPSDATTVRVRDGKRLVTDGPFAETKEWLSGFYIFECATLDEALDWAAKIPGATHGSIEVRPLLPM
jgi:hypothetical protein